jgi:hypothetical protein
MATVIGTDASEREIDPSDLDTLQEAVGGYIEMVKLGDGRIMYVNEDGLTKRLPPNPAASLLARRNIVGNVVVLTKAETKAELGT